MTPSASQLGRTLAAICIFVLTYATPIAAQPLERPLYLNDDGLPTLAPLLSEVTPAVVNISVESHQSVEMNPLFNDPFFRRFFDMQPMPQQPEERQRMSSGSGVIIDAQEGYILTNHHVIENGDRIVVTLKNRQSFDAELVGSDPGTDIALVKIDADGLTALELGDSDRLQVGDYVLAIGNPFGLGQTVTSGIVSALGRSGLNIEGYEDFIQTDASINPGNSGGALVTLDGRLIGINTAIIAPSGGNVGIGFAVPANMADAVFDQLVEFGEVQRGQLGVTVQDFTPDLADALGIETGVGAIVTQVQPDSAAERAGLQPGDLIVSVDGRAVAGSADLRSQIGLKRLGRRVEIEIIRDGAPMTLEAILSRGARSMASADENSLGRLSGAQLRNMEPGDPLYGQVSGVLVARLDPGSRAAGSGLEAGDIILAVNQVPVTSVAALRAQLEQTSGVLALTVQRGSARIFLVLR
ncbi:DegQ family serine endoprotease [Yoonia sediminilitoris]|uniref:Serine protease Do/serine protease DegQ n=1 Tax=Yoonia sediminilitoris TaxID=1286148 RepID=A0A2T6KC69_9RHOB|nr:DegQ family serine endoprotease [Yoonia sediminilitoris]PUB12436.1 serine protease Do/serine protease DegQ [Yoonia sediminilitoris]RCW93130.1 serine protease Do/serine protease DegQ [Yoonia sediminilitoris]